MQTNRHIFLSGFMGSGKSQLGKKIAALLAMDFIDLDSYIVQAEQRSIEQIFQQEGEEAFRKLETVYVQEVMALPDASVVALGGGTVCFNNNLQLVKAQGLLIYIELSAAALADRLKKSPQQRPLLKGLNGAAMTQKITELLERRKFFYEQAHFTVNGLHLTPQLLCRHILDFQKAHNTH